MLIALKKLTKILIEPFKYPHRPLDGFWYITYTIQVMKFQSSATELVELCPRNDSLQWLKFNRKNRKNIGNFLPFDVSYPWKC